MEDLNKQKWEELNLTRDELKNIGQALQKEEFRSLLLEYVKEISDPENRKQYEEEITELERERGVDVKFIHPSPGYVLKTSVNGQCKAFINVCSNVNVEKPSSKSAIERGQHGLQWALPYCLAPPREDVDKKNNICKVFDVVFHPDTLHLTKNNKSLKGLVDDTAIQAIEENFNVSLDKNNLKFPKMQFKGMKHSTVIRKKIKNFQPTEFLDLPNYPYQPVKNDIAPSTTFKQKKSDADISCVVSHSSYTIPKYTIKYRDNFDMQDFTNDPMSKMSITIPNEIVIVINLPLLKCSTDACIDVTENSLFLVSESPAKYKLSLKLSYIVDKNKGSAKFDSVKRVLTVTLPVIKQKTHKLTCVDLGRDDSGVESDNCNGRSNSISSGDEDTPEKKSFDEESCKGEKLCSKKHEMFLKPEFHFIMPEFTCQLLGDLLTFTFQVPNVTPDSVQCQFLEESSCYQMTFQSIGTGFYPLSYAVCVKLTPENQSTGNNEPFFEVWDDYVMVQVKLSSCDLPIIYFIGTNEINMEKCKILSKDQSGKTKFTANTSRPKDDIEKNGTIRCSNNIKSTESEQEPSEIIESLLPVTENDCPKPHIAENYPEDSEENDTSTKADKNEISASKEYGDQSDESSIEKKDQSVSDSSSSVEESVAAPSHRQHLKSRAMSESHEENTTPIKNRGILKIGRSLSESSVDDYASWSAEKGEKTKKTVRFSEVISKQTFRMNSSILGQRKKNQRKTRNKKRAQDRRLSESGGESEGEGDISVMKTNHFENRKELDVWFKEAESSSCDVSEVSDISESDDSQKEDRQPSTPFYNKKQHKRRGKKSARKSAATAKLLFMDN